MKNRIHKMITIKTKTRCCSEITFTVRKKTIRHVHTQCQLRHKSLPNDDDNLKKWNTMNLLKQWKRVNEIVNWSHHTTIWWNDYSLRKSLYDLWKRCIHLRNSWLLRVFYPKNSKTYWCTEKDKTADTETNNIRMYDVSLQSINQHQFVES